MAVVILGLFLATGFAGVANAQVYKDPNAPIEARVEDLLSRMTIQQKCKQMAGMITSQEDPMFGTPSDTDLGIPGFRFVNGPRGCGYGTCFPVAIGRAATWNTDLEYTVGEVMGKETRAADKNGILAPCLNLVRDSRDGRAQESYGEDSLLTGAIAVAFIEGVQSEKAMAQAKHYAVNTYQSQQSLRNAIVDPRTLNEVYLPHFKMAVDAGVASVMTSYNRVNGEYTCSNTMLVRETLKGLWGFDGFVVSDWYSTIPYFIAAPMTGQGLIKGQIPMIDENFTLHEFPTTDNMLHAGLDVEMPFAVWYEPDLLSTLASAQLENQKLIDDAVRRILRMKFEFGLFDEDRSIYVNESCKECPEHVAITRLVEQEAIVLLKNENNVLPFDLNEIKSIAVIGPAADDKNRLGEPGSSSVQSTTEKIVTTYAGIKNRVGDSITVSYDGGSDPAAAAELAKKSDAVVVVVGRIPADEGENCDLTTIVLNSTQTALVNAVGAANRNCAVVLIGGSGFVLSDCLQNAPALLMAWYPGLEGGNAIADVIFGDVNPSGKLSVTFPKSEAQIPMFDLNVLDDVYPYYHGYRYFDKYNLEPEFAFGHGLSYTTFEYSNLKIDKSVIGLDGKAKVSVDIENTGDVYGGEVVQLYIGYNGSAVDRAAKDLKGFDKVFLQPGEKRTVTIEIAAENVSYYSAGLGKFVVEPITYNVLVGSSSRDIRQTSSFRISTNPEEIDAGAQEQSGEKTPGFELIGLIAGLGVAIALTRRRK